MEPRHYPEGGRRRVLPRLLRRGSVLLHQQCWLWGCDIRREGGNALVLYGFVRVADPEAKRSTQYSLRVGEGSQVRLWGSGFYFGGESEGIFLNRFQFEPRLVRVDAGWQDPAVLKRAPRYMSLPLLRDACLWIAEYEDWMARQFGMSCRRLAISRGPCPEAAAELVGASWLGLANDLGNLHAASA